MFLIPLGMNVVTTPKIPPHLLEAILPSPTHKVRLFSTFKPWHPINQCAPRSTIPRANDVFADGVLWEPKTGFHVLGQTSAKLIGFFEDSKGLQLLGSRELLVSQCPKMFKHNFALKRVSSIPTTTCILSTKFSVWKLSLTKKNGNQKVKRLVLKQVSVKVGSSLPVRCMASWAKSAESKYPMLTWARDLLDYKWSSGT